LNFFKIIAKLFLVQAVGGGSVSSDDMAVLELEHRQDRILSRLEVLRSEVDRLLAGEKSELAKVATSCAGVLKCTAAKTSTAISKASVSSLQVAV